MAAMAATASNATARNRASHLATRLGTLPPARGRYSGTSPASARSTSGGRLATSAANASA